MKVYPDKKTERICNGVFYGGIATIAVSVVMILLTVLFGHGAAHVVLRVLGYAAFAAAGGLFAYSARIGIRPKFNEFFWYACIAVFVGGVMIAIDFAWVFGSINPSVTVPATEQTSAAGEAAAKTVTKKESHIGEMILAMTCFPIIGLSAFFLFALIGADAKKQFYELTRDRMMCIGASCATAVAGLLAILLTVVKHDGVATASTWEEIGLLVILLLAFGAPTALLNGCSRLADPVTDKEMAEGFKMAEQPKKQPVEKEKKPSGKPDNAAKQGKPGKPDRDLKKNADGKKEPASKEPEKKGKNKPEADKKNNEAPEEEKRFAFAPKGKKDKDRDRKKPDDRKSDTESPMDVISTTRKKPVESTNPTDLDAFLRKAEEEEERKERDAAWEAAREKKEAV
ncbi:MAG: hypothetical protein J6Y26_05530 [Lachnospiraceae bacterium]|nr:hypothetical protein [Lachnospiraceae bacterium]